MKTIVYSRDGSDDPSMRKLLITTVLTGAFFSMPSVSWAQQAESAAVCDEGGVPPIAEPVMMVYGDHTEGCETMPATDSDLFKFNGLTGEVVRINLLGMTDDFDPFVEVRDDMNSLVDSAGCTANIISTCSFTTDLTLSKDGMYTIIVSDQGTDNTGSYVMQLERVFPGPLIERLNYDSLIIIDGRVTDVIDESSVVDSISPQTDVDHYFFNGVAGTKIRFNVLGLMDDLDPSIEVRDPSGTPVLNGPADGAGCTANIISICSFSVNLELNINGTYTVVLYDQGTDNTGNYQLSLWCILGDCDNDGDGIADIRRAALRYGESEMGSIDPETDGEFFMFKGTPGDQIRFNVSGLTDDLDPTIEVRDPAGMLVLDGRLDGAGCTANIISTCSFSKDYLPQLEGAYTMVLYDEGTDNIGNYQLNLECVFSPVDSVCENLPGRFPIDVLENHFAFSFIEKLIDSGITSGCGIVDRYCPDDSILRDQMAVFIERGINGGNFQQPECQGDVFDDVGPGNAFCGFIEQFFADGITSGCGPGIYCPKDPVTRAQMAVFLLRAEHGAGYIPPECTGTVFADVSCGDFAAAWIEQLAAEGITAGCATDPDLYCPEDSVTRAQMAVFVVRTFALGD